MKQDFRIGPHKAYQLALQLKDHPIILISQMDPLVVKNMLLTPAKNIEQALHIAEKYLPIQPMTALLPYATHLLPKYFRL